ncbi:sulfatase-like hydrolase/transferase [Halosimplex aquaticum]
MDVVWIVLDSLSFSATPFAEDGPDTMPRLATLADEQGVIFENAYTPGPSSPSAHGSFFTGQYPSETGMHEAYPYLGNDVPTIAEVLSETHRSLLISANPYISNGLQRGFDELNDLLREQYMLFESGNDPREFEFKGSGIEKIEDYLEFVFTGNTPLRSLINGLVFKRQDPGSTSNLPERVPDDSIRFQYAETMNNRIQSFRASDDSPAFVVANYMDIHPPLDISDEAIEQFFPNRSHTDLPVGKTGQEVYELIQTEENYDGTDMYDLLKAAIWDTDRRVGPLVSELISDGAFVVVTADHGIWFRRDRELDEERLHVPLLLFPPIALQLQSSGP